MNAIVGLCHFCEAHGPRPLFCTFTTDDEKHTTESSKTAVECTGCTSLGAETVYVSRDDSGTIFCSRESVQNADITAFLRQAAIRSITCEVSWSKEGGVVYFSETQGHVLSLMFQLQDTRARGLKRWFSIVVLMKDKMLLLNITPVLSEHMLPVQSEGHLQDECQELRGRTVLQTLSYTISKELQGLAETVFNEEQKICSQRALRLKTGSYDFGQSRSLIKLTGDENIFKRLHSHFTWMLKAGALTYSETLHTSHEMLNKMNPETTKRSIFAESACNVPSNEDCMPLRALENLLSKEVFRILLYCTLTGINVVIKPQHPNAASVAKGLTRLYPISNISSKIIRISDENEQVLCMGSLCILDSENNNFCCKWPGTLPSKCPTIMNRIEASLNNLNFNDEVLHQHLKSLQLEWLGIARAMKAAVESSGAQSAAVANLKKVFGLTPQDELLVNYWITSFC